MNKKAEMTTTEAYVRLDNLLGEIYDQVFYNDRPYEFSREDYDALEMAIEALKKSSPAQAELIERSAYVRGFEQGRTQGMIDANLQPTCNQLATDCINRQDAINVVAGIDKYFVKYIEQLPSAQPEIVRCKDCKHYDDGLCRRWKYSHVTSEDSFCSGAERREDAEIH